MQNKYVTVKKFSELTGYSAKAIYNKIYRGDWIYLKHWTKAPDGHIILLLEPLNQWMMGIK